MNDSSYEPLKGTVENPADPSARPERRRRWASAQKLRIVQETLEPGAVATLVARRYGISTGLLYTWRKQALAGVIEPRVEEIFSLVQQVVRESGYEEVLSSGIVLTGGSSVMPGMIELGEDIFLKPVRRGIPKYSSALADMVAQPRAATVMGLLEEARLARLRGFKVAQKSGSMKTAFGRFKDFIVGNF